MGFPVCRVFGPSYAARGQEESAGQTSSQLPTVFERPDQICRKRSRTVARIDLISSYSTLILSACMLLIVVKAGKFEGGLLDVSDRQDAFWGVRVIMELISIPFAVKLLKSTSQFARQQDPKGSAYWCNVWLMSCAFWIFFYFASIAMIVKVGEGAGPYAQTYMYMKISIMATIIVLRLGEINIVIVYTKDLSLYSHRQLNAVKSSVIVGIQPIVQFV